MRGELTVAHTKEQFSLKNNSFIAAVASSLQASSSEVGTETTFLEGGLPYNNDRGALLT